MNANCVTGPTATISELFSMPGNFEECIVSLVNFAFESQRVSVDLCAGDRSIAVVISPAGNIDRGLDVNGLNSIVVEYIID